MELLFLCTVTGKGYFSANWRILGDLAEDRDALGGRTLKGTVEAECPLCGGKHAYGIDELVCPLSPRPPENEREDEP